MDPGAKAQALPGGKPPLTSDSCPLAVCHVRLAPWPQPALEPPRPLLGFCMCPGRAKKKKDHTGQEQTWARDLGADLQRLRSGHMCDALVTLLPYDELKSMGLETLGERAAEAGLAWQHFPIHDKRTPSQGSRAFVELVEGLVARLRRRERVIVHCNGGKGRSAMVVAAALYVFKATSGARGDALSMVGSMSRVWEHEGALRNPLQQAFFIYAFMCWRPRRVVEVRANGEPEVD